MFKETRIALTYIWIATFVILGLGGCSSSNEQNKSHENNDSPEVSDMTNTQSASQSDINWVYYADAKADANLAIAKQDFQLLAFSNRSVSLPGVDLQENPLEKLQSSCGYRFLSGAGDTLKDQNALKRRKALQAYAIEYNRLVLSKCLSLGK
jgi:hypothetical protein